MKQSEFSEATKKEIKQTLERTVKDLHGSMRVCELDHLKVTIEIGAGKEFFVKTNVQAEKLEFFSISEVTP